MIKDLKRKLEHSSGGDHIFCEYKTKGYLSDRCRKLLVNVSVSYLIETISKPRKTDKINLAKIIIELFPLLKDSESSEGYVSNNFCYSL